MNKKQHNAIGGMSMFRLVILSTIFVGSSLFAQLELDNLKNTLSVTLERIELEAKAEADNAGEAYLIQLERLKAVVQTEGSLEKITEVINEIERFKIDRNLSSNKFQVVSLQQIHYSYALQLKKTHQQRAVKIRNLFEKYDDALERLKKSLVKQGDLEPARTVKEEQDRAQDSLSTIIARTGIMGNAQSLKSESTTENVSIPNEAVTFGGHRYALLKGKMTFQAAEAACAKLGGHLLRLESEAEEKILMGAILGADKMIANEKAYFWLDLKRVDGQWRWGNGVPLTYVNKNGNFQNSAGAVTNGKGWWGVKHEWGYNVICEWPNADK